MTTEIEMEETAFPEEPNTPEDGDYIVTSEPLATYHVKVRTFSEGTGSRDIGEFKDYPEAYAAIKEDMKAQNWFSTVWYADEHNCFIDAGFTEYCQDR